MGEQLLALEGVGRVFGSRPPMAVLADVCFEVIEGRNVGIVGESGAGKTTILRLMLGLDAPTTGQVRFRGTELDRRDRALMRRFRREVQIVFQDPRSSLDPRMNVGRIIAEPLSSLRIESDHNARVTEVLGWVGLEQDVLTKFPAQFSGGQRQRIAIARALAPAPRVLVADEPVSALDAMVREQILDLLGRLGIELGLTLVMVSHDVGIVRRLCAETIVLRGGRIEEAGPTARVLSTPESPYTQRLLAAIPTLPHA